MYGTFFHLRGPFLLAASQHAKRVRGSYSIFTFMLPHGQVPGSHQTNTDLVAGAFYCRIVFYLIWYLDDVFTSIEVPTYNIHLAPSFVLSAVFIRQCEPFPYWFSFS